MKQNVLGVIIFVRFGKFVQADVIHQIYLKMLEKDIEGAANKILKQEGWKCLKVKFHEAGYPDRLYIHLSGVLVWIEWKRNETQTKPYPLQVVRLRELTERHMNVTWTDNSNDGVWFCRNALVAKGVPSGRYQNATGTRRNRFVPGPWPWESEDATREYVDQ